MKTSTNHEKNAQHKPRKKRSKHGKAFLPTKILMKNFRNHEISAENYEYSRITMKTHESQRTNLNNHEIHRETTKTTKYQRKNTNNKRKPKITYGIPPIPTKNLDKPRKNSKIHEISTEYHEYVRTKHPENHENPTKQRQNHEKT